MGVIIQVKAQAGRLPDDEVKALGEIAAQVGKKGWNFKIDPCINESSWATPKSSSRPLYNNSLICNCSYPHGACHVVQLFLKGQDLAGVLPPALAKLPYLKTIDLTLNYLSGNIPREWASTKSITVNNLSGPIPSFLGNITTLKYMSIESNLFSGMVPIELGKLVNLENLRVILSSNNLTGVFPVALTSLTKLTELRISSNNFTGRMPDFFQSWKQLRKLEIQASGFKGPIPSSISILSNLTELRISDLVGEGSKFPNLSSMTSMKRLMLRSCNISGPIPTYISDMTQLQILDLSFNRLEGKVPDLGGPTKLEFTYLTSNLLTGPILDWIKSRDSHCQIDISYNSLLELSAPTCREYLNLFKSFSGRDNLILSECLTDFPCSKDQYSLHINCGGKATTAGKIKYEEDVDLAGAAKYVHVRENWGFSSTGNFWDVNTAANDYVANNVSQVHNEQDRTIHKDNRSFYSLGRQIFDVYVQEKLVRKDFDIENTAQGVDKVVVEEYKAVVTNKVLMICFYWAGKGTTAAPKRGPYGPLISAISVESDFSTPDDGKIKISIVVGAIVLVLLLISMILCILWWKGCLGGRISREKGPMDGWLKLAWSARLKICVGIARDLDYEAIVLQQKGNLMELVDPELGSEFIEEEALRMIKVALLCANASPALRSTMTAAVSMLEGLKVVLELTMDSSIYGNEWRFEGLRDQFGPSPQPSSSESHSLIQSSNAT
ncbi:probable leucine-rich repeat receptor-like serine/threonine-protein kinase At3g14840 [Fagus crenata]